MLHTRLARSRGKSLQERCLNSILIAKRLEMRTRVDSTYAHWCIQNHADDYPGADRLRTKIRAILDEVDKILKSRRPSGWCNHQLFWTEADVDERDAELAEAIAEGDADIVEGEMEEDVNFDEAEVERLAELAEAEIDHLAELAEAEGEGEDHTQAAEGEVEDDDSVTEGEMEDDADVDEGKSRLSRR